VWADRELLGLPDVVGPHVSTTAEVRANVLLDFAIVFPKRHLLHRFDCGCPATVEALRKEFAHDLAHHKVEHITGISNIAIVAVVGENMRAHLASLQNLQMRWDVKT